MNTIMNLFAYPAIFLTLFMTLILIILIAGVLQGLKYLYFVTYKHYPKLVQLVDNSYEYYEYDVSLKKYVRNDLAVYDVNDPKLYKIQITEHLMSF